MPTPIVEAGGIGVGVVVDEGADGGWVTGSPDIEVGEGAAVAPFLSIP